MNSTETNKKFAEFLGWQLNEKGQYKTPFGNIEDYLHSFHNDWNWVMLLVVVIESLDDGSFDVSILQDGVIISHWKSKQELVRVTLAEYDLGNKLNFIYQACSMFVDWYNGRAKEENY